MNRLYRFLFAASLLAISADCFCQPKHEFRAAWVASVENIDWTQYSGLTSLGLTAGASAPEVLVEEVLGAFDKYYDIETVNVGAADEDVVFPLPASLRIAGTLRNEDRSRAAP